MSFQNPKGFAVNEFLEHLFFKKVLSHPRPLRFSFPNETISSCMGVVIRDYEHKLDRVQSNANGALCLAMLLRCGHGISDSLSFAFFAFRFASECEQINETKAKQTELRAHCNSYTYLLYSQFWFHLLLKGGSYEPINLLDVQDLLIL